MPQIPIPQQQVTARSTRQQAATLAADASPDDFGAATARAEGGAANALSGLGGTLIDKGKELADKQQQQDAANAVAQSDFTKQMLAARKDVGPSGKGYQDAVLTRYDNFVDDNANNIADDKTRMAYRARMAEQRSSISSNAASYEYSTGEDYSKAQATNSLMQVENRIAMQPTMYDEYVKQGNDVIAARPGMTATQISAMQDQWRQNAVKARFEGQLEAATSVDDINGIALDLAGKGADKRDWSKEFNPDDYEHVVSAIGTAKAAFTTKADADARAALETLDQRNNGLAVIAPEELAATETVVRQSQNPITQMHFARIQRDQSLLRSNKTATPAQLQGQINSINGAPGAAYPGIPAQVSQSINKASQMFPGVSASYLGGVATREYGSNLTYKPKGNAAFAPKALSANVDIGDLQPYTRDALTVAGQEFGAPFVLNSGYRSQAKQDALRFAGNPDRVSIAKVSEHTSGNAADISTVGMSEPDKARAVTALVNAGFTGIGEYDTHIHADFRQAVPNSFGDQGGKYWGGWTYLSPEVANALISKGFKGGASSDQIARGSDAVQGAGINYTVKNPNSSASGLMQFTDDTFVGIMRSSGKQMGIDVSAMSDAQILKMRDDPDVSTLAAAAYASQNKTSMESALGRPVDDGELYLAHFLGAGGAVALISAMKANPNALAADLLPKAAAANKSIFYNSPNQKRGDGGKPKTVRDVYNQVTMGFALQPTQMQYGDAQTLDNMKTALDKGLKDDPMTTAQNNGVVNVPDISNGGGMSTYGTAVRSAANYYNIPVADMKPLTAPVEAAYDKQIKDGNVDQTLQIMANVEAMGGDVAKAALKQLGEKNSVFGFAGGLALATGDNGTAADIIRGQKRQQDNPAIKDQIGKTDPEITAAFNAVLGPSLSEIAPADRQAIQDAALAHYVETFTARNGSQGFNDTAFATSVQKVLGGTNDAPAVQYVNGAATILPKGVTSDLLETAMNKMTVSDWTNMSPQKTPPLDADGNVINPLDMAQEAQLRTIGGGQYKVLMGDGNYAITGKVVSGGLEAYIFQPDPQMLSDAAARPSAVEQQAPPSPPPPTIPSLSTGDGRAPFSDPRIRVRVPQ